MHKLLKKIEQAIDHWAKQHGVDIARRSAVPSGIGSNIHVEVIARQGFENWPAHEREADLYKYLHSILGDADIVKISLLLTLTEDDDSRYTHVDD